MVTQAIPKQKAKMAMALRGKKNRYEWLQLTPRHFLSTAKAIDFSQKQAMLMLLEVLERSQSIVQSALERLPRDFPAHISEPILNGVLSLSQQHLPTVYGMIEDYAKEGDYEYAIALYAKSLSVKTSIGDKEGQAVVLDHIARLYHNWGDVDNAIEYYTKSLDISTKAGNQECRASTLHSLANIYFNQDKLEHALAFYTQAFSTRKKT